jgi:hypothetical protein
MKRTFKPVSRGVTVRGGVVVLIALAVMFTTSCATSRMGDLRQSGIRGRVTPVDENGEEIKMQDKDKIIITALPLKNSTPDLDRATTVNAKNDGTFTVDLREGKYVVEIFLEGFYVWSGDVALEGKRRKNLGEISLARIMTEAGLPIRGDEGEVPIGSEGDVNIQPPVN